MALRRLANILASLSGNPQSGRNDQIFGLRSAASDQAAPFMEIGSVTNIAVGEAFNTVFAIVKGRSVACVQATDEPLQVGQQVWVSQAETGAYVVHGTVR